MMMRWPLALVFSLTVVMGLFTLMQQFIAMDEPSMPAEPAIVIEIASAEELQQQQQTTSSTQSAEPEMAPLNIAVPAIELPSVNPALNVDVELMRLPAIELQQLKKSQQLWRQPGQASAHIATGNNEQYSGRQANTKRRVTPVSTRRPNIPKIAHDNKVDGWVLLAFTVNPDGHISDIQVMDAHPRGIFETNAIEALRTWRYSSFQKTRKRDPAPKPIRLSQKIEFKWSMYSYNLDF